MEQHQCIFNLDTISLSFFCFWMILRKRKLELFAIGIDIDETIGYVIIFLKRGGVRGLLCSCSTGLPVAILINAKEAICSYSVFKPPFTLKSKS
ncbi:hypothetical protein VNO77_00355 [Canavalia gladiata]|uniref:Uncharacterized protein n=1 Tax=Canavalia gladiata TaxID=3824 RepID=A0AAN9R3Y1_CANGL